MEEEYDEKLRIEREKREEEEREKAREERLKAREAIKEERSQRFYDREFKSTKNRSALVSHHFQSILTSYKNLIMSFFFTSMTVIKTRNHSNQGLVKGTETTFQKLVTVMKTRKSPKIPTTPMMMMVVQVNHSHAPTLPMPSSRLAPNPPRIPL